MRLWVVGVWSYQPELGSESITQSPLGTACVESVLDNGLVCGLAMPTSYEATINTFK
jgi:hypothetical protein